MELYTKLKKYKFHIKETDFLSVYTTPIAGYIVISRVYIINHWLKFKTV